MAMSPGAVFRGVVSRLLPTPFADDRDNDKPARYGRYGEIFANLITGKQHGLADEGAYFVAHNAQTGIATSLISTAFSQTTLGPFLIITNTDTAGTGKSIYLDYLNLICTAAGTLASAGTNYMFAWSVDQSAARYTSGGTDLTASAAANGGLLNVNTGVPKRSTSAQINAGALTLAAASSAARIIVPQRLFRLTVSTTAAGVVQDEIRMNFGGIDPSVSGIVDLTTAKTVAYREVLNLPPIVIAPQHCAILHLWSPGSAINGAISYLPELGYWER